MTEQTAAPTPATAPAEERPAPERELPAAEAEPVPLTGQPVPAAEPLPAGSPRPFNDGTTYAYAEDKPYGSDQVRHAYVLPGDTLALVIQSRKGKAGTERVPSHQTLILQNQLLG
jgi:hypothetical protein